MSGVLKGIGKVFKKVAKVVKKVALPALAIGAVVLTGGAALGVLPSITSVAGSLGLSPALTGILGSAAKSATFGAVGSLLTGGNPLKGATAGFITGGVLGGLGQMAAGRTAAPTTTGGTPAPAATPAGQTVTLPSTGETITIGGGEASAPVSTPVATGGGMGSAAAAGGGVGTALSFLERNPILTGTLVQGIGSGLMASSQYKAQRKAEDRELARYDDTSALFRQPSNETQEAVPADEVEGQRLAYSNARFVFDKNSGRVRLVQGA